MQKPSKVLVRVSPKDETLSSDSVSSKLKRCPRWFGRIPATVLLDPELDDLAIRMYGIMTLEVWQGNVCYIGMRLLGELAGVSAATAMRRVKVLIERQHISVRGDIGLGQRNYYVLNSKAFAAKQATGVESISRGPSGQRRLTTVDITKPISTVRTRFPKVKAVTA